MKQNEDRLKHIDRIVKNAPNTPGVYKMLSKEAKIIYVGKAINLRSRLQSYFRASAKLGPRKEKLVEKVTDIKYIEVDSELEALVLETNLIKEHLPKYNVLMKDDKNYVYIRVTVNEQYPRISLTRHRNKDGALYIGPKTGGFQAKSRLKILKRLFPYRHCRLNIEDDLSERNGVRVTNKVIKYPCLDYHIKRCDGPCIGDISKEEYRKNIDILIEILQGNWKLAEDKIRKEITNCVATKNFEQAAKLRDQLEILTHEEEVQKISDPMFANLDVVNFVKEEDAYFFNLFKVREGKIVMQYNFLIKTPEAKESDTEVLQEFLTQYYSDSDDIPEKTLLPIPPEAPELITSFLTKLAGRKVSLIIPARGRNNELLKLALKNAKSYSRQMRVKWLSEERYEPQNMIKDLKETLELDKLPKRIECFDISHLGGTETVGSMVVFENGLSKNSDYRHFQIRSLPTKGADAKPDDFKSMEEVLSRRFKYLIGLPENYSLRKPTQKQLKELDQVKVGDNAFVITRKTSDKNTSIIGFGELHFTDEHKKQALLGFEILSKKSKNDLLLIPVLNYCFNKWPITKLSFAKQFLENSNIDFWDLGVQESRQDSSLLILEKHRFSFSDKSLNKKPDLIIIDGGKGQLSSTLKAADRFNLNKLNIVSLAKKREEVFRPNEKESIIMIEGRAATYLVKQIRDEAHRFAISHNRKRRDKKLTESQLDKIPGIGPKTKQLLLQKFGSIEAIAKADESELKKLTNKEVASLILKTLK